MLCPFTNTLINASDEPPRQFGYAVSGEARTVKGLSDDEQVQQDGGSYTLALAIQQVSVLQLKRERPQRSM